MSCSICQRSDVRDINAALWLIGQPGAESLNAIARRLSLPKSSLSRHKNQCLTELAEECPEAVPAALEQLAVSQGNTEEQAGTQPERSRSPFAVPNPGDDPATAPRKLITAEIERRCMDLRVEGRRWTKIAEELGISESTAIDAVERVMIRSRRGTDAKADQVRTIEVERLARMFEAVFNRAITAPATPDGHKAQDAAIASVLRIMERKAKLEGLDIPTTPSTVNIIAHPMVAPVFHQFMAMVRRVLELALPTVTNTEGQTKVIKMLVEAAVILGDEGERALEVWFSAQEQSIKAIDTTAEVVE